MPDTATPLPQSHYERGPRAPRWTPNNCACRDGRIPCLPSVLRCAPRARSIARKVLRPAQRPRPRDLQPPRHATPRTLRRRPRLRAPYATHRPHRRQAPPIRAMRKTGGLLKQASLGSRRRRSGRHCVGARSHRRPVRCPGRCNRGRSHHRDVSRVDGVAAQITSGTQLRDQGTWPPRLISPAGLLAREPPDVSCAAACPVPALAATPGARGRAWLARRGAAPRQRRALRRLRGG